MAFPSTPRAIKLDDEDEIYRLNDDEDDGENVAPTKVGPMSKAFVDQLMFKAHLAETIPPRPASIPPESGHRPRAPTADDVTGTRHKLGASKLPRLNDDDDEPDLAMELTVLSDAAIPIEALKDPGVAPPLPARARVTPLPVPAPAPFASDSPLAATPIADALLTPPPFVPSIFSATPEAPPFEAPPPDESSDGMIQAHPSLPVPLYVEPSLSPRAARWMASSYVYPLQQAPARDTRLMIQVAVVITALVIGTVAAIIWLFP